MKSFEVDENFKFLMYNIDNVWSKKKIGYCILLTENKVCKNLSEVLDIVIPMFIPLYHPHNVLWCVVKCSPQVFWCCTEDFQI